MEWPRDYARSGRWPPLTPSLGSQPHHEDPTSFHERKILSWNIILSDLGYPASKALARKFEVFHSWSIFMNPPKRARWYFLHCWRVHFASWKCLHKHIKYTSLIVDVNYSWPDTPILPDPGHSDQHGNSNHTRQYLRVATLTNLANLPTPVNLAISAKPFWPFCPPWQPWPTQATFFLLLKLLNRWDQA